MIRQVYVVLTVVMLTVLTFIGNPANAAEMGNLGTEQSANQYAQTLQNWKQSDGVQYAQVSWPFQQSQTRNQGEQTQQYAQEPQDQIRNQGNQTEQYSQSQQSQTRNQGEQTQQYTQEPQTQARNQNNQSEQPQYQQQQQSPNQIPSQNNQEQA